MGRFSKLERETQDAIARRKALKEEKRPAPPAEEVYDAPYYIARGDEAFFTGEFKKALQLYSRAIQVDNTQHSPWIGQIYCLIEMNQLKEADLWTGRALEMFPEDGALLSLRAITYAHHGMLKRALGTSDYALSKGADIHTWIARGEVLLLADNKNASFCFSKAMEMADTGDWKTPMRIGLIFFRQKAYSQALDYFQKACAINVTNHYLWYHLGKCYHRLGFGQKAIESFRRASEQNPEFREAKEALEKATHTSFLIRIFRRLIGVRL